MWLRVADKNDIDFCGDLDSRYVRFRTTAALPEVCALLSSSCLQCNWTVFHVTELLNLLIYKEHALPVTTRVCNEDLHLKYFRSFNVVGVLASAGWWEAWQPYQGNQELLVVRDKAGRPPGELGVSKSMECDIFPFIA